MLGVTAFGLLFTRAPTGFVPEQDQNYLICVAQLPLGAARGRHLCPSVSIDIPTPTGRMSVLWWDGDGLCLFAKRLERGRFVWQRAEQGVAVLTPAQLAMLLEGIDWRRPVRTAPPELAG